MTAQIKATRITITVSPGGWNPAASDSVPAEAAPADEEPAEAEPSGRWPNTSRAKIGATECTLTATIPNNTPETTTRSRCPARVNSTRAAARRAQANRPARPHAVSLDIGTTRTTVDEPATKTPTPTTQARMPASSGPGTRRPKVRAEITAATTSEKTPSG